MLAVCNDVFTLYLSHKISIIMFTYTSANVLAWHRAKVNQLFRTLCVAVPPTDTPPTPDIPDVEVRLDIPNWALSVWNVGQTIVSYLAGVGSASLGVVCLNKYKQKREERKKRKKLDAEKGNPIDEDIEMTKGVF